MSTIVLVVARADNGVIGRDGALPWHLPRDLAHFRALTLGKPVIMGRRTFEAIGRPLPGRHNIVLTRSATWQQPGVERASGIQAALAIAGDAPEIMVIGGGEIYAAALPLAHRIELTQVHAKPSGDAHFPALDPLLWREEWREAHSAQGDQPAFTFTRLSRR